MAIQPSAFRVRTGLGLALCGRRIGAASVRFPRALGPRRARFGPLVALLAGMPLQPLQAQPASSPAAQSVVVSAARVREPLAGALADVVVLSREAIERSGASCAADLLAMVPGIEFARNGGPAGTTSLYVRGSETRHVALYIDGLRVDAQATGGAPWELLPIEQIERVEVVRGAAAAVYGSDAVGGVIQLFTRSGAAGQRMQARIGVGSHGTQSAQAGLRGLSGALDYQLSAAHARSAGFNARALASANPDADGWRRSSLGGGLGLQIDPRHRAEASILLGRLWSRYDGFGAGSDDQSWQTLQTIGAAWLAQWQPQTETTLRIGESRNTYESQPASYRTETTLRQFTLQGAHRIGDHRLTMLLERREDHLLNPAMGFSPFIQGERHQDALALGWRGEFGAQSLQVHLRHDQDSQFGGQPTASLAWGLAAGADWHLRASAASTFRAPTLYQRFSEYGQADLAAESGRTMELALRHGTPDAGGSLTLWHTRVSNLIVFGAAGPCASTFGCYQNASRAATDGASLEGHGRIGGIRLDAGLDWHDARNLDTDRRLPRRARLLARLAAQTHWSGWGLGAQWVLSGDRFDDAANAQRLGGYGLVNLQAERAIAPDWIVSARVENLGDKAYEVARTYPTGGRQWTIGLRWSPR